MFRLHAFDGCKYAHLLNKFGVGLTHVNPLFRMGSYLANNSRIKALLFT